MVQWYPEKDTPISESEEGGRVPLGLLFQFSVTGAGLRGTPIE